MPEMDRIAHSCNKLELRTTVAGCRDTSCKFPNDPFGSERVKMHVPQSRKNCLTCYIHRFCVREKLDFRAPSYCGDSITVKHDHRIEYMSAPLAMPQSAAD